MSPSSPIEARRLPSWLRESYREAGTTRNRTLANLSRWPAERTEQLRAVLRGDKLLPTAAAVEIVRALPHGHVLAALGTHAASRSTRCWGSARSPPGGLCRARLARPLVACL